MADAKVQKSAEFLGNSLKDIQRFPDTVKQRIGFEIHKLQCGENPTNFKPMKSVGAGVFEIRIETEKSWYRTLYVTKFEEAIYILHAFQKKTNRASSKDIEAGKTVYKQLVAQMKEEGKE